MSDVLTMRTEGAVALLTLNRPDKLNALSNELLEAIVHALDRIELDAALRAVVITGAGRAFSAGGVCIWTCWPPSTSFSNSRSVALRFGTLAFFSLPVAVAPPSAICTACHRRASEHLNKLWRA